MGQEIMLLSTSVAASSAGRCKGIRKVLERGAGTLGDEEKFQNIFDAILF